MNPRSRPVWSLCVCILLSPPLLRAASFYPVRLDDPAAVAERVTEASYRTRGLAVTYTDTENRLPKSARQHFAFFLETRGQLAKRLDAEKADIEGVRLSRLDTEQAAIVFVFQYLIGNTDWSLAKSHLDDECCHNVDLLQTVAVAVKENLGRIKDGLDRVQRALPSAGTHLALHVRTGLTGVYVREGASPEASVEG